MSFAKSSLSILSLSLVLLLTETNTQAAVTLWTNDFESGLGALHNNNTANITTTVVTDPTNSSNKVLEVRDTGTASPSAHQWGEIRPGSGNNVSYDLNAINVIPGVDKVTFSIRFYIPTSTVGTSTDDISLILRFSDTVTGAAYTNSSKGVNIGTAPRDVWTTLTISDLVIPTDGDGTGTLNPLTRYIIPIISLPDYYTGTINNEGVIAYIDNISLVVTPEPGRAMLLMLGSLLILARRSRTR